SCNPLPDAACLSTVSPLPFTFRVRGLPANAIRKPGERPSRRRRLAAPFQDAGPLPVGQDACAPARRAAGDARGAAVGAGALAPVERAAVEALLAAAALKAGGLPLALAGVANARLSLRNGLDPLEGLRRRRRRPLLGGVDAHAGREHHRAAEQGAEALHVAAAASAVRHRRPL